jgi:hypothetical protein
MNPIDAVTVSVMFTIARLHDDRVERFLDVWSTEYRPESAGVNQASS